MDSMPVITYGDSCAGLKALFSYLGGGLLNLVGMGEGEKLDKPLRKVFPYPVHIKGPACSLIRFPTLSTAPKSSISYHVYEFIESSPALANWCFDTLKAAHYEAQEKTSTIVDTDGIHRTEQPITTVSMNAPASVYSSLFRERLGARNALIVRPKEIMMNFGVNTVIDRAVHPSPLAYADGTPPQATEFELAPTQTNSVIIFAPKGMELSKWSSSAVLGSTLHPRQLTFASKNTTTTIPSRQLFNKVATMDRMHNCHRAAVLDGIELYGPLNAEWPQVLDSPVEDMGKALVLYGPELPPTSPDELEISPSSSSASRKDKDGSKTESATVKLVSKRSITPIQPLSREELDDETSYQKDWNDLSGYPPEYIAALKKLAQQSDDELIRLEEERRKIKEENDARKLKQKKKQEASKERLMGTHYEIQAPPAPNVLPHLKCEVLKAELGNYTSIHQFNQPYIWQSPAELLLNRDEWTQSWTMLNNPPPGTELTANFLQKPSASYRNVDPAKDVSLASGGNLFRLRPLVDGYHQHILVDPTSTMTIIYFAHSQEILIHSLTNYYGEKMNIENFRSELSPETKQSFPVEIYVPLLNAGYTINSTRQVNVIVRWPDTQYGCCERLAIDVLKSIHNMYQENGFRVWDLQFEADVKVLLEIDAWSPSGRHVTREEIDEEIDRQYTRDNWPHAWGLSSGVRSAAKEKAAYNFNPKTMKKLFGNEDEVPNLDRLDDLPIVQNVAFKDLEQLFIKANGKIKVVCYPKSGTVTICAADLEMLEVLSLEQGERIAALMSRDHITALPGFNSSWIMSFYRPIDADIKVDWEQEQQLVVEAVAIPLNGGPPILSRPELRYYAPNRLEHVENDPISQEIYQQIISKDSTLLGHNHTKDDFEELPFELRDHIRHDARDALERWEKELQPIDDADMAKAELMPEYSLRDVWDYQREKKGNAGRWIPEYDDNFIVHQGPRENIYFAQELERMPGLYPMGPGLRRRERRPAQFKFWTNEQYQQKFERMVSFKAGNHGVFRGDSADPAYVGGGFDAWSVLPASLREMSGGLPVHEVYRKYIDYLAAEGVVGISDPAGMETYRQMIDPMNLQKGGEIKQANPRIDRQMKPTARAARRQIKDW